MNKKYFLLSLLSFIFIVKTQAQSTDTSIQKDTNLIIETKNEIKGLVLDMDKKTALPYANIFIPHKNKGTISNELGDFSIDISDLRITDTLCFQYIGYKTKKITIGQLNSLSVVYLKEEIINLSEALVFGNPPNPESIVKKVIQYKDSNYRKTTSRQQIFIREREIVDFIDIDLKYKKSSIPEINIEMLKMVEEKIPKHSTSFSDFLTNVYFNKNQEDSIKIKSDPIRIVELKEKDIAELKQIETIFEKTLADTKEKEYWKVKSGIFSQKLDKDEDEQSSQEVDAKVDSIKKITKSRTGYYNRKINSHLTYCLMNDKDQWEFLYKTGKYKYKLIGGARVNGEDVYIIDFTPKNRGLYEGRMYISLNTYALIRADYEYAFGKIGNNFQLLGIGVSEDQFAGSIYFEKKDDNYVLKYFSHKAIESISIKRNLGLVKKRKRWLFDKKLQELSADIYFAIQTEESVEYLVLNDKNITAQQFADFKQEKSIAVIYVDQFDDKLWSDYPIIEPTKQMKEYKKQKVDFMD
jgi:hypothetical protein